MEGQVRAIIWSPPRTCSTALVKCLSGIPNSKIFNELYSIAFLFGPDKLYPSPPGENIVAEDNQDLGQTSADDGYAFPNSICTYDWIKATLQKDYPGKEAVFAKEISFCLNQKYDSLPRGYRHIFLVRNPHKVFPSWKKLMHELLYMPLETEKPLTIDDFDFDKQPINAAPTGLAFKEAYDLFEYVKEKKLEEDPIIIEADDLVNNPAGILSALCGKLGLPYSDSLLTWDKGTDILGTWTLGKRLKWVMQNTTCFENFRNSTSFQMQESDKRASASPGEAKVTADIQRCIDFSMPYYLKMYEQRLEVDDGC